MGFFYLKMPINNGFLIYVFKLLLKLIFAFYPLPRPLMRHSSIFFQVGHVFNVHDLDFPLPIPGGPF
jgi:hypothetical protein